jgi:hypothetical protein
VAHEHHTSSGHPSAARDLSYAPFTTSITWTITRTGRIVDLVDPVVDPTTLARTPTNNTSKSTHIKDRGIGAEDPVAYPTKETMDSSEIQVQSFFIHAAGPTYLWIDLFVEWTNPRYGYR